MCNLSELVFEEGYLTSRREQVLSAIKKGYTNEVIEDIFEMPVSEINELRKIGQETLDA